MDFTVQLASMQSQIEHRLAELVPPPDDIHDILGAALHEGVLAPGKRIRPLLMLLMLLVGRSLGPQSPALLDLGCAVKMVQRHLYFWTTCRAWTLRACAVAVWPCMQGMARMWPCWVQWHW